jgi:hypothetical protein
MSFLRLLALLTLAASLSVSTAALAVTSEKRLDGQDAAALDALRGSVAKAGLDPDSESGKVMLKWLAKAKQDPEWREVLGEGALTGHQSLDFSRLNLSPAARLDFLQHFGRVAALTPPALCGTLAGGPGGFGAVFGSLPPEGIEQVGEMMDAMVKGHRPASQVESYTTAELLSAENAANMAGEEVFARHGWGPSGTPAGKKPTMCDLMSVVVELVKALPEPQRTRITWAFLSQDKGVKFGSIITGVLANPYPYLDESFDEHALPDALRRRIGAEGSMPLPFQKLTVTGNWGNREHPEVAGPFELTFVNRRNDGTVSKVIRTMSTPQQPTWGSFAIVYGPLSLRQQTVTGGTGFTVIKQIDDKGPFVSASTAFVEHAHFEFAEPQPSTDGAKLASCDSGRKRPASEIFPTLKGDAVEYSCEETTAKGQKHYWRSVWLYDYAVSLPVDTNDDEGLTTFELKSVTISPVAPASTVSSAVQ